MSPSTRSRVTTDHEEIRRWAEQRGARPAAVARSERGDDPGIIRLDFPGDRGEGSSEAISWDEWFRKFDKSNLALLFQDETAGGQKSNFNKIIRRDTAEKAERAVGGKGRSATHKRAVKGVRAASSTRSGRASASSSREHRRSR